MTRRAAIPEPEFAGLTARELALSLNRGRTLTVGQCCVCGDRLSQGRRYLCGGCGNEGLVEALALLERDREQRQRTGTGWRPGMRICYATECYPPEEDEVQDAR